ncbi:MAG: hypothetical protein IPJ31_02865 [Bacteroidetes bacterium]|nr:hypothetical protein [Bacteroidota bacterium]MBP6314827.1 hypothetical protein [Chitinophagaceae bacterium]
MSIKYTPATLKKFEELYDEMGYSIRFEKGNFNSGYCILEAKKIVVINKFLTLEGRINAMIDILPSIEFDCTQLNTDVRHFYELAMASPNTK